MKIEVKGSNFKKNDLLRKGTFGVAIFLGLEAAALLGSYVVWRKMNRDQDFRFKVHEVAPFALEYYYKVGEMIAGSSCRADDEKAWKIKKS